MSFQKNKIDSNIITYSMPFFKWIFKENYVLVKKMPLWEEYTADTATRCSINCNAPYLAYRNQKGYQKAFAVRDSMLSGVPYMKGQL